MTSSRQRPTTVFLILAWLVIGGVLAAWLGSELSQLMILPSARFILNMATVATLGLESIDAVVALGYLFFVGGLALLPIAYFIDQQDRRARQWGMIVAGVIGVIQVLLGVLAYSDLRSVGASGFQSLGGPVALLIVVGALSVAAAYLLYRNQEVEAWFGGASRADSGMESAEQRRLRMQMEAQQHEIEQLREQARAAQRAQQANAGRAGETVLQPAAEPLGWLVNRTRGTSSRPVGLDAWSKLGRNPDCHVQLHSPSAGREHAVISYENGHYYVSDMNSKAGTYVNNQRIMAKRQLFANDEIRLGDDVFVFLQAPPEKN